MEKMPENLKEDAELPKSFIDLHQDDDGIWVGEMDKNKPTDIATPEQLNQASGNLKEQAKPNQGENSVESVPESADQLSQKPEGQNADISTKSENETKPGTYQEWKKIQDEMVKKRSEEIYNEKVFDSEDFRQERIKKMKDKHPDLANLSDEDALNKCNWFDAEDEIDKKFEEETEKKYWNDEEYRKKHNQIKIGKTSWIYKNKDKTKESTEEKPEGELGDKKERAINDAGNKEESSDDNVEATTRADKKEKKERAAANRENKENKEGVDKSSFGRKLLKNIGWNFAKSASSIVGVRWVGEAYQLGKEYKARGVVKKEIGGAVDDSLSARYRVQKIRASKEEIDAEAREIRLNRMRPDNKASHEAVRVHLEKKGIIPDTPQAEKEMSRKDRIDAIKQKKLTEGNKDHVREKSLEKYKELKEKLEKTQMPPEDKSKVGKHLRSILVEYKNKEKELDGNVGEKINRVFNTYMSTRARELLVAKESLNAISIALAAPYLRGALYSGFALLEKGAKATSTYDKEHFDINKDKESLFGKEKITAIKDSFINSFKETVRGFNVFNNEKSGRQRGAEFASSFLTTFFTALRIGGLAEYWHAGQTGQLPTQDIYKIKDMIVNGDVGDAGKQMWQNWTGNMGRLAGVVDGWTGGYISDHLKSVVGYAEKSSGIDIHNYLGMKSDGDGANGAVDYEKFNKVFGTGPRGEVPSAEEIQRVQISSVFGADSPIAHKIMEGGVTPDEARLVGSLNELGLRAVDLHNFQGAPGDLSHLVDQVSKLNLGVSQPGILKELISNPIAAKNFNNQAVQDILAKGKFSSDHIKEILSAKQIATIDKSGGSISEALGETIGHNDKVMVVNPDGKILHNFDANLAHRGDTVVQGADGTITVFKTSDVSVKAGQSLEKVYTDIAGKLDKAGVPNEVRERFNEGVGHWGEKITHGESEKMLHFWSENKTAYEHLTSEQQQEFLHKIHSMKSEGEISKALNEIYNAPAHSVAEAVVPATEVVVHPAENVAQGFDYGKEPNLTQELKSESAYRALHNMRRADLSYPDIKQREELSEYINKLHKQTGFQPRGDQETVGEYMKRTRDYIDGHEVLKADLRHTPEAIPNTASWPPADGRSGADRIHFNPYSDAVGQGAEVNVIKTSDNIRLGGDRAVVNHITGIFGEKKAQFSVPADLDKISAWKEVRGQLAGDVINGKLNKPSGWFSWLSGHKKQEQYDNLRKYLEDLKGKHNVNPVNKETVGDYVKRAEEWLSRNRAGEGDYNPNIELK